ncbi:MAG: hypothetical protein KatS3mg027_0856 [Bacteroidia bacterium]|nr:MAG: hypothetical protein KatS3mg027_0856 [Bacteroidia bacterium]
MELYNFEMLSKKMDEWGFPRLEGVSGFRVIKDVEFEKAFRDGKISFENLGIYLEYEGKKYKGYMFIKEYLVQRFGLPRFHLVKCQKIEEFIIRGKFKERYVFSNSSINDVIDLSTKEVYKNVSLKLCKYCQKKLINTEIYTTEDFFNELKPEERSKCEVEVDIFGYERGFEIISKRFRAKKNYVCESCGISPKSEFHRRFWHTHHKDGNKINNAEENLQCLCILCHIFVDKHHEKNFNINRFKKELENFIEFYKDDLQKIGNPYLKNIFQI